MPKCFIDSKIIADWIIIKNARAGILNPYEEDKFINDLKKDNSRAYYSYAILQQIGIGKFTKLKFYTAQLAMSEVTSVIFEKHFNDEMAKKNIPLKYQYHYKNKIKMPKEVLESIAREIIRFYMLFIIKQRRKILLCKEPIIQDVIELITQYGCATHDAYLVCQAIRAKCDIFVTDDNPLKDSLRNYQKIRIISSQQFFHEVLECHML